MKQRLKFEAFPEFVGKPMIELYKHLQKNYAGRLAEEKDLTEENIPKDNNWYYAFGSLRIRVGSLDVPTVRWFDDELNRDVFWLENDWDSHDRVVLLETEDGEFPIGVNNWKQYGLKYGYWNFFETEIRKDWITLSSKHQRLKGEIQKISKWPEPSPKTGEGGPGPLWTSGLLTQYQHDKEKHEKEIADILKLLE